MCYHMMYEMYMPCWLSHCLVPPARKLVPSVVEPTLALCSGWVPEYLPWLSHCCWKQVGTGWLCCCAVCSVDTSRRAIVWPCQQVGTGWLYCFAVFSVDTSRRAIVCACQQVGTGWLCCCDVGSVDTSRRGIVLSCQQVGTGWLYCCAVCSVDTSRRAIVW